VLVRRRADDSALEVRLYNFQLAAHEDGSQGTVHLSALAQDRSIVYRAPELIEDPSRAGPSSDVFSLGAIAYHVLTGSPPGTTLTERNELLKSGALSIAIFRDDLAGDLDAVSAEHRKSLDDVVRFATESSTLNRADDVLEWLNMLLDSATAPANVEPAKLDPLEARLGDRLEHGLEVKETLGTGSTAKVLRVIHEGSDHALKIALAPEHDERLRAEADALEAVRCDRIVTLEKRLTISGRTCLLLSDAGETLAELIASEGPVSLDYAERWGADLLRALGALEEKGVQHRDIKPANLGVTRGASKKARHLLLFDFSLAGIDPTAVTAGTPAYRDPFVTVRGRWDEAADRYAAAVTLHEMLTGVRPRWGKGQVAAIATDEEVTIEAERLDASVRDRLVAFFRKAFGRDAGERHEDAAKMLAAWHACFAELPAVALVAAEKPAEIDEKALAQITETTPIDALPLSNRARNALDRSGVVVVRDLLRLQPNQLSAIRGVGRETAVDIFAFQARYLKAHPSAVPGDEAAFFAGFKSEDVAVGFVPGLPPPAAAALEDAGLGRVSQVASTSQSRVERILQRFPGATAPLVAFFKAGDQGAGEDQAPATIEAWIAALLPPARGKRGQTFLKHVRLLFGLEPESKGPVADAATLATELGVTRQMVSHSLEQARERWGAHPFRQELESRVAAAVSALGGLGSVPRIAQMLPLFLPHEVGAEDEQAKWRAEALVRVVGDIGIDLCLRRLSRKPWLAQSRELLDAVQRLGVVADEIAAREPLPSSEQVREALSSKALGTPLAALPAERLVGLAADASEHAARSARLELYPRGMSAERAINLSAGALTNQDMTEDAVRRVITTRYPDAAPLPPRPEFDALVAAVGLAWSDERGTYVRHQPGATPTVSTQVLSTRMATTHSGSHRPRRSPELQESLEFDERLRLAAQRGYFRVAEVAKDHADRAAVEMSRRLGVEAISLERLLIDSAWKLIAENEIDLDVVYQADREGPSGEHWPMLRDLMCMSADRVASSLSTRTQPVLLTSPGLLARFGLDDFLGRLVESAQRDDGPGIVLVNPVYGDGGAPRIEHTLGALSIPVTSPAQTMRVPTSWIQNTHRAGAP
jgi:serine/threonine protein kinase